MRISLLLFLVLAAQTGPPTGTITGNIEIPPSLRTTKPNQVALLTGEYVDFYQGNAQQRMDTYWEDYRSAFIQDKEAFMLFRERAKVQAFELTLSRMRANDPLKATTFILTTSDSKFEFRGVPQGECKVVARITAGNQEFVWSDSVIFTGEAPAPVHLKPTVP